MNNILLVLCFLLTWLGLWTIHDHLKLVTKNQKLIGQTLSKMGEVFPLLASSQTILGKMISELGENNDT